MCGYYLNPKPHTPIPNPPTPAPQPSTLNPQPQTLNPLNPQRPTRFSRTEILGKTMASLQGPATDRQALSAISNSVRDGREHFTTLVNYNKSGVPFVNQLYVCPLLDTVDSTGVATLCMGVLKDVTAMHVQQSSPLGLIVAAVLP
ncbi:hypothetical protein T484DRAFT_2609129 [Baffinella frigidus]|nr:hypothetical protein T484DRAFT_2609129 [Cryptophyta sp. CCMP2293]